MGILSGVISYLFGLSLNLLDVAIDGFLGTLGFDLNTFETYFPAVKDYYDVIIGFAVGLLFMMLIFQIFRNFGVMLDNDAEDPLKMLAKTALSFGMIMYSRSIMDFIIKLLVDPYSIFLNAAPSPYEFKLLTLVTSMFTSVFSNPFMAIVAMILMLVMGWQFLKLTIECVERYIVFCFILCIAPVVYATSAFKSTAQIFKSWCRMLASQAMLLLLNIWSIKLFLSFLPIFESDMHSIIFNFLIGYAFLKFAQKADTLLRILGLNTASTGDMVRSLGGTIASIAFAVRSMSGAAGAIGKAFGGAGSSRGSAAAAAGGAAGSTAGSAVGGMAGAAGSASTNAAGAALGGAGRSVAASAMNTARQSYVNDVLSAAKSQQNGGSDGGASHSGGQQYRYEEDSAVSGLRDNVGSDQRDAINQPNAGDGETENGIAMGDNKTQRKSGNSIDAETREGLANIAHGMPHNKYDPIKKSFSGGEFPEFTGENANLIGASQFTPADGFEQHGVKMRDGSVGTLYQNPETGEAHLVQFGSVDNGVIQGAVSEINKDTGQFGDFMGFKAVHESVPGAESFSGHSVPISDGTGGVYHVSSGAATSFFAPGHSNAISGSNRSESPSTPATPSGSAIAGASDSASPAASGMGDSSSHHTTVSSHETSSIHSSSIGTPDISSGGSSRGSGASRSDAGGFTGGGEFGGRGGNNAGFTVGSLDGGRSGGGEFGGHVGSNADSTGGSLDGGHSGGRISAESPPVSAGMKQQPDNDRRFSKNNPANMEVFKRENSGMESFDRSQANPDSVPTMGAHDEK